MLSAVHTDTIQTRRNSWIIRLTNQEIEQLQREKSHLEVKSSERPLTPWENLRQQQVFRDLARLVERARALGGVFH